MRRALPELVVAALPDQLVDRRRTAFRRRAPGDDRAVRFKRRERERVEVGPGALGQHRAVAQRQRHRAVLGRLDRSAVAQEVPVGVDFVLVDERRPLARDEIADVLQLGQPRARRERRVVIGRARWTTARRRKRRDHEPPRPPARLAAPQAPQHPAAGQRREQQRRRGDRERLAGHPWRAAGEVDPPTRPAHATGRPELPAGAGRGSRPRPRRGGRGPTGRAPAGVGGRKRERPPTARCRRAETR